MKRVWAALVLTAGIGVMALPVSAQTFGQDDLRVVRDGFGPGRIDGGERFREVRARGFDDILSERRIARIVRRSGFAEIEDIRLRRDRYLVTAVRPNGAVFRLALDARDGDVIGSERIGWSRGYDRPDYDRYRPGRHHGPGGFEFRFGLGG